MKKSTKKIIFGVASAAILLSAVPAIYAVTTNEKEDSDNNTTTVQVAGAPIDFTQAAESTINSVVSIKSFATPRQQSFSGFSDPFFDFFFGPGSRNERRAPQQAEPQQLGLGSGVIIKSNGYIVTNNHVINGAEKLEVTINGNKAYNAKVIGSDESTDLALLKIDETGLDAIKFGDSDDLKVGEWVLAVGNPFGFTSTVTAGIVSAKSRSIGSATHSRQMGIDAFIQTDAAVNPGNSGGALVNTKGELVGINTAIYSQTGNYAGYSFAIPTSIVKKVIGDLMKYGTVQRAVLGIRFGELTPELIKEKNVKGVTEGIYVGEVIDMSAAKEAGIKEGDVITEINGNKVRNSADMQELTNQFSPGDKTTIKLYRDGKKVSVSVTFKNAQGSTTITKSTDFTALGCAFQKVPERVKTQLGISGGVQVAGLKEGRFKNADVPEGFIILSINNQPVNSQDDVENIYDEIMRSSSPNKVMFITGIYTTGKRNYMAVPLTDEE